MSESLRFDLVSFVSRDRKDLLPIVEIEPLTFLKSFESQSSFACAESFHLLEKKMHFPRDATFNARHSNSR
jgi:hypothetical protein